MRNRRTPQAEDKPAKLSKREIAAARKAAELAGLTEEPTPATPEGPGGFTRFIPARDPSPELAREIKRNEGVRLEAQKADQKEAEWERSEEGQKCRAEQNRIAKRNREAVEDWHRRGGPHNREDWFSQAVFRPEECLLQVGVFLRLYPSKHDGEIMKWLGAAVKRKRQAAEAARRTKGKPGRHEATEDPEWVNRWREGTRWRLMEGQTWETVAAGVYRGLARDGREEETARQTVEKFCRAVVRAYLNIPVSHRSEYLDSDDVKTMLGERFGFRFPEDCTFVRKIFDSQIFGLPGEKQPRDPLLFGYLLFDGE